VQITASAIFTDLHAHGDDIAAARVGLIAAARCDHIVVQSKSN
jgi:hypothetical protein